jgi:hypothetical protein
MPLLGTLPAALLLGGSVAAGAADKDAEFHLSELFSSDLEYRQAWQQLLEGESRLPDWVIDLNGVAPPMQGLDDDGDKYLAGQLCEARNCFNQRLYVAFSWDKDDAYALYVQLPDGLPTDRAPSQHADARWLDKPDARVRQMLEEQLKSDPNGY